MDRSLGSNVRSQYRGHVLAMRAWDSGTTSHNRTSATCPCAGGACAICARRRDAPSHIHPDTYHSIHCPCPSVIVHSFISNSMLNIYYKIDTYEARYKRLILL